MGPDPSKFTVASITNPVILLYVNFTHEKDW